MFSGLWARLRNNIKSHDLHSLRTDKNRNDISLQPFPQHARPLRIHSDSPSHNDSLGIPTPKKRLHITHICATLTSFACLAVALAAVANESFSFQLGIKTYQLIVLGAMLSVMSFCLLTVASPLFLLLEARFGPSTLQNYDALLSGSFLGENLSLTWRAVMLIMMIMPIVLSVAYKSFSGGQSNRTINNVTPWLNNSTYCGMFTMPGLQNLGSTTGITLFSNATLPFEVATSPSDDGVEPPLPSFPQAYGFNVLLLNNKSTAILDIPQYDYITSVQRLLNIGESWNVTAPVLATVATYNHSQSLDKTAYEVEFISRCEAALASSGAISHQSLMNDWAVQLMDAPSRGNESWQYVGYCPDSGIDYLTRCSVFMQYAYLFSVTRQQCAGTWSITRGGMTLTSGSCTGVTLPPIKQSIITNSSMFLGVYYMMPLAELLGAFATSRNGSAWYGSYMSTAIAAMVWSRIVAQQSNVNTSLTPPETYGIAYPVSDAAVYVRPAARRSAWLYFVLVLQPVLTMLALASILWLHRVPIDTGFGLIAVLSGIEPDSLHHIAGAALSGKLDRKVPLLMRTTRQDRREVIRFEITPHRDVLVSNERISPGLIYH